MGIEQHLMRLQEIGPNDEGAAVAQLRVRHLQFGALIADDGPIFRPIELEGFAGVKRQGHICPAARRLQFSLPIITPFPSKCRNPIVGALVAKAHQIGMQLLHRPLLLAVLLGFALQPGRQPISKRIKLAWPLRDFELRLHAVQAQVFADGIPGQASPAANLPDR